MCASSSLEPPPVSPDNVMVEQSPRRMSITVERQTKKGKPLGPNAETSSDEASPSSRRSRSNSGMLGKLNPSSPSKRAQVNPKVRTRRPILCVAQRPQRVCGAAEVRRDEPPGSWYRALVQLVPGTRPRVCRCGVVRCRCVCTAVRPAHACACCALV